MSERVHPIVEKGLLFSYTVRDRKTEGTVYIAPDGQACWFTSDGADVVPRRAGQCGICGGAVAGLPADVRRSAARRHRDGDGTVSRPDIGGTEQGIMTVRPIAHIRTDFPEKFGIPRRAGASPIWRRGLSLNRPTVTRTHCGGWRASRTSGCCGSFPRHCAATESGNPWYVRRASAGIPRWVCSPRVRPSVPTRSVCPPCGSAALTMTARMHPRSRWQAQTDGRHAALRYQAVPCLYRQPSGGDGGFAQNALDHRLRVHCPPAMLDCLPERKRASLLAVLAEDPRPSYQHDPERLYGLFFAGFNVEFTVDGDDLYVLGMQAR